MATLNTANLTPMQLGRLNSVLDSLWRWNGEVKTLREHIEAAKGEKREWDGMCDWNRRKFNNMDQKQQIAYEARLKAKRYYTIDGFQVAKIVYDAVGD